MNNNLLLKGFEVELFTGDHLANHVGIASELSKEMPEFIIEPDLRNIEFITEPTKEYNLLRDALILPRIRLRKWLSSKQLTLIPGSTLSMGGSKSFERSDLSNSYHDYIEKNYGAKVVTTSVHINIGVKDLSKLFAAVRLIRCEAALLLSLSASSPFLNGKTTGVHSQRWLQFPLTPNKVPIFLSHDHYVHWIKEQLSNRTMQNERHLWTSVRPNGPKRPYKLDRIELRICDLITDVDLLLAITALLELRVIDLFKNTIELDPINASKLDLNDLQLLCDRNDKASAEKSLDSTLFHWLDGKPILCRDWISSLLKDVLPLAKHLNMADLLTPIYKVLEKGNQSMRWIDKVSSGQTVQKVLQDSIVEMKMKEESILKTEASVN
tara:strand:+ start:473 stop:1615 length:1143 start_codon:yes stop_codon:yes gene_type:complete